MGFFETLADAEKWVEAVHGRFPDATATVAPAALLRPSGSKVPAGESADGPRGVAQSSNLAPVADNSLTDTQVLRILDARGVAPVQDKVDKSNHDGIALLRPDDTDTRRALKEAVVQGAPVSFAVQLHWSAQPIDLSHVPSLAPFKAHTLYSTESRREGHSRYFLRLGFFGDPISAKEVAAQVRSNFATAAVVPVTEQEVTRARAAVRETAAIPYLGRPGVGATLDSNGATAAPRESRPPRSARHGVPRTDETLEQTLERLAERETWTDPDSLSDTGVRHLRVDDVEERHSR
jgi:hypothetical protein